MKHIPFLLRPVGKDYLWGGERLKTAYHKQIDLTPLAETWECSTHPDGCSVVDSGAAAGKPLRTVLQEHPEYLGTYANPEGELPILIKLIDAKKDLSVQVHPNDDYAARVENGKLGKTEAWLILDAPEGSQLVYGIKPGTTLDTLRAACEQGAAVEPLLRRVTVHPGDVCFIPAGCVHAIGAGIMLYEIQQSSDITYRFYDWDRVDKNGNRRELHLQKALDVTDLTFSLDPIPAPNKPVARVLDEKYFTLDLVNVQGEAVLPAVTAFGLLTALDGDLNVHFAGGQLTLRKGESAYIPHTAPVLTLHGKGRAALSMPR